MPFFLVFFFQLSAANTTEKFPGSEQMTCNILWSHPSVDGQLGGSTFTLYSLILGFAVPLSLILVFYYLVIKKLQTVGPKNKSKDKKRSHRKVTRLVLTVITVYVLCWCPYWVRYRCPFYLLPHTYTNTFTRNIDVGVIYLFADPLTPHLSSHFPSSPFSNQFFSHFRRLVKWPL